MNNRGLFCLGLACVLLAITGAPAHAASPAKPNVLFVLADQWRASALGYAGDPNVKTPNLDRLAEQGIQFVNAISSVPVCCPARASLLTGQRALTHGVFMNDVPLAPEAVSLGKLFHAAGYDTGYIGKWHLNAHGRSNFIPRERRQGFDYWKVLECTHDYSNSFYYADSPEKRKWDGYDAFAQTQDAIQYLRDRGHDRKPFFLFLAWGPPHDPYQLAPENYQALYPPATLTLRPNVPAALEATTRKMLSGYYAHCSALDACVGDLRRALQENGLEENTLLIFTSDHGDLLGSHGARNKQQPYDESIRVPFLLHWPAELKSPRRLDAIINTEDILPTLLGLCRLNAPKTLEGLDFGRHIRGGKNPGDGAALIACIAPFGQWTRQQGGKEYRGIRTARYTFVRSLQGPWLLFDNQEDPYQMSNRANQPTYANLQAQLEQQLQNKLTAAGDKFLPAGDYLAQWGYKTDAAGTVPYAP